MSTPIENFAHLIMRHARAMPNKLALSIPTSWTSKRVTAHDEVTYGQLWWHVESYRKGLRQAGYQQGDRFVLMFPVGVELYALTLALFAEGMVAVLVDTGMGIGKMLQAIEDANARAFVSTAQVLKLRPALKPLYSLRCYYVDDPAFSTKALRTLRANVTDQTFTPLRAVHAHDHALITFTSGSTGRPKGADRTHGHLRAQHDAISAHFPERVTDRDCPCFPVVTLHNLCCGITTFMPAVDLRAPGSVEPDVVLDQLQRHRITRLAAAPAFMSKLADAIIERGEQLPHVRALFVGGGPVSLDLCARIVRALPQCKNEVVYGSTEAEPMTSIDMTERLASPGEGTLVGYVAHCATLRLVNLPNEMHQLDWRGTQPYEATQGEVGEVIVTGEHVNKRYVDNDAANRSNKLIEPDGTIWHRTGDMGRWDQQQRLWLVGRLKSMVPHRDQTLHPFAIEERIEAHPDIHRAALVPHPFLNHAVLLWSPETHTTRLEQLSTQIREQLYELGLEHIQVMSIARMPVDRRHNTKIDRVALGTYLTIHQTLWPGAT